jgi:squalene-hopene/tetraprenyl-beta-curcumene cyclase
MLPVTIRVFTLLAFGTFAVATAHVLAADWNPQAAARYLDERQKQWFEWKPAASVDGPCVSCHTGMTYLLARPVLRRVLNEEQPTPYERGLLDRLRARVGEKPPGALQDVETIFAALFLARVDDRGAMSAGTRKAFEQLWSLQLSEGPAKGAWKWYAANLDPWEHSGSSYFGASLAMLALGSTPADYQQRAEVRERASALETYLAAAATRPLHDRLALLWASSSRRSAVSEATRTALIDELFSKQQIDGGWTLESLGPWTAHPDALPLAGSDAYATGFAAFALGQGGVSGSHPGMSRALAWLRSHQNPKTGAWLAVSMNKRRPAGSMEALFMQDAATAFAALALIENTP